MYYIALVYIFSIHQIYIKQDLALAVQIDVYHLYTSMSLMYTMSIHHCLEAAMMNTQSIHQGLQAAMMYTQSMLQGLQAALMYTKSIHQCCMEAKM